MSLHDAAGCRNDPTGKVDGIIDGPSNVYSSIKYLSIIQKRESRDGIKRRETRLG